MKKYFFILLLIPIVSCSDYLNEELRGDFSEDSFYQNERQAVLAVNAAYQPLSFASDNNRLWVFGDVASDDADKGGDPGDQADIGLIDNFQVFPNNGPVETQWAQFYEGIARTNRILARISQIPAANINATTRDRLLGEARFLRALYYFYLVNIYGPIPVSLEPKNPDQLQITQSPVAEVYANAIEPDLREAIRLLPVSLGGADAGRATRGAANALLARASLYQGKWQQAFDAAQAVINSGQYDLLPVYELPADRQKQPRVGVFGAAPQQSGSVSR